MKSKDSTTPPSAPQAHSKPGETIQETIDALGITQTELAKRMNRPIKTVNEIINGKARITEHTALDLERVLKVPAEFWMRLEMNYRLHIARLLQ